MHQGARPDEKGVVLSIHRYVSIYRRPVLHPNLKNQMRIPQRGATQPLGLRWGFETTSRESAIMAWPYGQDFFRWVLP